MSFKVDELSRYVVLNPLRARMVNKLGDWHWSSFKSMVGKATAPEWMETDWILSHFGGKRRRTVTRHREFVGDGKGFESVWDSQMHPVILGDEVFVESIYRKHVDQATVEVNEIGRCIARPDPQCFVLVFRIPVRNIARVNIRLKLPEDKAAYGRDQ